MIDALAIFAASAVVVAVAVVALPLIVFAINRRPGKPPLAWTCNR